MTVMGRFGRWNKNREKKRNEKKKKERKRKKERKKKETIAKKKKKVAKILKKKKKSGCLIFEKRNGKEQCINSYQNRHLKRLQFNFIKNFRVGTVEIHCFTFLSNY